jgi:hypothetical protein
MRRRYGAGCRIETARPSDLPSRGDTGELAAEITASRAYIGSTTPKTLCIGQVQDLKQCARNGRELTLSQVRGHHFRECPGSAISAA